MIKSLSGKEEEECHSIEEEERLQESPESSGEPARPEDRWRRSRCTKGTQTQLGHQPIAREEEEEDQGKRCEEITHT